MRRFLLAALLWLVLAATAWPAEWTPTMIGGGVRCCPGRSCTTPGQPLQAVGQKYPQVVEVVAEGDKWKKYGTGVIIDRSEDRAYVATCAHTLRGRSGKVLVMAGGKIYEAVVVGEDVKTDTAILVIQDPGIRPIGFGLWPARGARTWIGGFSLRVLRFTAGAVRGAVHGVVEVTGGALDGWSGGPIIDSQGRLVGILSTTDKRTTQGIAIVTYRRLFCRVVPAWRLPGQAPGRYGTQPSPGSPAPIPSQPDPNGNTQAILTLIAELQAEVKSLQGAVETLAANQPAVGPPGPQGLRGPPGETATIDLNALVDKVIAKLPPARYQAKNPDGTLHGPLIEKRLGETLFLKSVPVE